KTLKPSASARWSARSSATRWTRPWSFWSNAASSTPSMARSSCVRRSTRRTTSRTSTTKATPSKSRKAVPSRARSPGAWCDWSKRCASSKQHLAGGLGRLVMKNGKERSLPFFLARFGYRASLTPAARRETPRSRLAGPSRCLTPTGCQTPAVDSLASPLGNHLYMRDELGDQVAVEGFQAAFAADAAVLDAAERRFGQGAAEMVDVDHAGFQPVADLGGGLQRVGEHV